MDELEVLTNFRKGLPSPTLDRVQELRTVLIERLATGAPEVGPQRSAPAWWRVRGGPSRVAGSSGRGASESVRIRLRKRVIALASALAVATSGGVTYFLTQPDRVAELVPIAGGAGFSGLDPGPATRDMMAIFDPSQPVLVGGSLSSLEDAALRVPYSLFRPDLGADTELEVWVLASKADSGTTYETALRYGSTLVVTYDLWPSGVDPEDSYMRSAAEWKAGYVTTIEGNPAWVVPANDQGPGEPPVSVVHVSVGEVEVTLLGRMPVDQLVTAAETLHS